MRRAPLERALLPGGRPGPGVPWLPPGKLRVAPGSPFGAWCRGAAERAPRAALRVAIDWPATPRFLLPAPDAARPVSCADLRGCGSFHSEVRSAPRPGFGGPALVGVR